MASAPTDDGCSNSGSGAAVDRPLDRRQISQLKNVLTSNDLHQIIDGFERDTEHRIAQIEHAVVGGDFAEVKKLAHGIAGLAGNVGAARLAARARLLCDLNEEDDATLPDFSQVSTHLRAEADVACGELRKFVDEP